MAAPARATITLPMNPPCHFSCYLCRPCAIFPCRPNLTAPNNTGCLSLLATKYNYIATLGQLKRHSLKDAIKDTDNAAMST
ncbi:hypothetical protein [Yersinia phage PY54]|uniref:hypothetical protein n=1 Tax=Yersinia phage PY54 TaxID=172667 RepID=UPI00001B9841|nr:hypothetical protein PY54p20 [Yersinia phage PY54]CAD91781.1 hypothetical protein [Yersinia phage PY54]